MVPGSNRTSFNLQKIAQILSIPSHTHLPHQYVHSSRSRSLRRPRSRPRFTYPSAYIYESLRPHAPIFHDRSSATSRTSGRLRQRPFVRYWRSGPYPGRELGRRCQDVTREGGKSVDSIDSLPSRYCKFITSLRSYKRYADGQLHPEKSLSAFDAAEALKTFNVNTIGHLLTYKHFTPLVPTRKEFKEISSKWAEGSQDPANGLVSPEGSLLWSLSARVGSIADNEKGGWYSYRSYVACSILIVALAD
jgi:hypothetical protein